MTNDPLAVETMIVHSRAWCVEHEIDAHGGFLVELCTLGGAIQKMIVPDAARLDELVESLCPPEVVLRLPRGIVGTMVRGPGGEYFDLGQTMESQIEALERGGTLH